MAKKPEIGTYVVKAEALYVHDLGKWRPSVSVTRLRSAPEGPISQAFNYLPVVFETETEAIRYGFTKGKALVKGEILGLTI